MSFMKRADCRARPWDDYELLDSGGNRKLERYGAFTLIRPETQAIWNPARREEWTRAHAEFRWVEGNGVWKKKNIPDEWELSWRDIRFTARLTSFKHTGMFPEQEPNWEWIAARAGNLAHPRVLNLFGYTGIASIVAAKRGAEVTHVDASKQSNAWARGNAARSQIPDGAIRFILDDALKFTAREVRRGAVYDGIILDPPAFGRGPKGEVWKIEEDFPRLLEALHAIFAAHAGAFFLLNGYAAGYSPHAFLQAIECVFGAVKGEFGELHICESHGGRCVPSGIYARFVR